MNSFHEAMENWLKMTYDKERVMRFIRNDEVKRMSLYYYETAVGNFGIAEEDDQITHLYFEDDPFPVGTAIHETPLIREAAHQLRRYLQGDLKEFTIPLNPKGTAFLQKVWSQLTQIPYGKTMSYQKVAVKIGSPRGARAVGMANNRNPIPIFIPCHRVIGTNGSLTGYRGGVALKQKLIELERSMGQLK